MSNQLTFFATVTGIVERAGAAMEAIVMHSKGILNNPV